MRGILVVAVAGFMGIASSTTAVSGDSTAGPKGPVYDAVDAVGGAIAGTFDTFGDGLSATAGVVNGAATAAGIGPNPPVQVLSASDYNGVDLAKTRRRR